MEISVANRLTEARKALGLSQRAFAAALGLNHASISLWERGKCGITVQTCLAIETTHNISASWLMTGKGGMFNTSQNGLHNQLDLVPITQLPMIFTDHETTIPLLSTQSNVEDGGDKLQHFKTDEGFNFNTNWLLSSLGGDLNDIGLLKVEHNHMWPNIQSGHFVFVRGLLNPPEYCNGIWLLGLYGVLTVLRVELTATKQYKASSDNALYQPILLNNTSSLLGRVIAGSPKRF